MAALELDAVTITAAGTPVLRELTFDLVPGAALAIVGRAGAGKTVLAEVLAGYRRPGIATAGRIARPGRAILVGPADDATALARKLSRGAALIIADEPGARLELEARRQLLTALLQAARDHHAALLVLTRDIRLPLAMALEIAVLSAGAIVERGPAAALADRPHQDATRELLAAERPRTRTLARPPVGEVLLEFDKVTLRGARPPGGWLRSQSRPLVLDLVSFTVRRGEAIGLLGGAGAGKTTLLRLAAGFGRAGAGRLSFARQPYRGNDLPRETQVRMAFVFSDPRAAFNPALPVGVTLTEPLRVEEQLLVDEQADGLAEAVRAVGFEPDILARQPHEFTNAELQRLALARALVGRPSLILLDEPTRTLDPVDEADFLTLFSRIRADYGMTVLVASRRLSVLRPLADRVHVLQRGLIVEDGTPTQLQQEAAHPATLALLAAPYPGPLPEIAETPPQPAAAAETQTPAQPTAEVQSAPAELVTSQSPPDPPAEPVAAPPAEAAIEPAAAGTAPAAGEPASEPAPASGVVPPAPAVHPSPSAQPADESAESGEAQLAVEGGSNRTRRIDPADDEAWG